MSAVPRCAYPTNTTPDPVTTGLQLRPATRRPIPLRAFATVRRTSRRDNRGSTMAATQAALGPGRAARALAVLFLGSFVLGSGELLVGRRAESGRRRPPGLHPRGRRAGDRLRAGPRHRRADRPGRRLEPGRRCLASPATLGSAIRPRHWFCRVLGEKKHLLPKPLAACPQAANILALSSSNPARP